MILTKKLKLKINKECREYLEFASEQCRLLYNFGLSEKKDYYEKTKKYLSPYEQKKQLPKLKEEFSDYSKVYNKCLSAMYFRLDDSFKKFFAKHNKFPRYKRKGEFTSQEYPGMYVKRVDDYGLIIPSGKGNNNFVARCYEKVPENYRTVTIQKSGQDYFACFTVDKKERNVRKNKQILAIDLGVKQLAAGYSSKKEFVNIPKFSHYTRHIDKLQSKKDKCKKNSRRYKKWNGILRRQRRKYLNRTNDYLHKASYYLTSKRPEATIVVGKLNLNNMKTKQSWFNRIIQNEWKIGRFVELLEYKSKLNGKNLIKIDERYTTKMCSNCGKIKEMKLSDRVYKCSCGLELNRDYNSAINIIKKYCEAYTINKKIDVLALARNFNNIQMNIFEYR